MGQIINFENPQLLVDAQWYPPPQGDPQDIRSFAREQAYICCIGKTHAVFRFIFIRELPAALYDEDKVIRRSIKAIGVDILLEHNSSKSALGKIEATVAEILLPLIGSCPRELALLIVQYQDCRSFFAETLYSLVIQEALTQRKTHCRLGVQNNGHLHLVPQRRWGQRPQECLEDRYEIWGSISATLVDVDKHVDLQKENFKTESRQRRWICRDASYTLSPIHYGSLIPWITQGARVRPSSYIRSDYLAIHPPPPANPIIQPIINECREPLEARDREIPPFVFPNNPPERSCLEIISDFLHALWDTLSHCFRAIIDCCR